MNYGFIIDNRRCIGCHACTVACKAEHNVPLGVNRTWVKYVEKGAFPDTRRTFTVHRCNHCADPPCVEICPVTSLFLREDGIVDFDSDRCIGCKSCMQACPYDALYIDPETHTSAKCNYCAHRVEKGIEPACVIVCPVHAIISGDMDDPASEIARLLSQQPVTVRKAEKGTQPKLFYIDGDAAALSPEMAPPSMTYTASEQAAGVGHHALSAGQQSAGIRAAKALGAAALDSGGNGHGPGLAGPGTGLAGAGGVAVRRTYDAPEKGVLWGWEVSGYLWTKSIAAGVLFMPLLLNLMHVMVLPRRLEWGMALVSLLMLAVTGGLLVKDLDRPDRFLYVLLRPQWGSWLVRGAYILAAFSVFTVLWLGTLALSIEIGQGWIKGALVVLGVLLAGYTAFLFAQAKGRDFWQSPLMPVHMVVGSAANGSAVVLVLGLLGDMGVRSEALITLEWALALNLMLTWVEHNLGHVTGDTAATLRVSFWSALLLGNAAPLALLLWSDNGLAVLPACVMVLLFAMVTEHVRVRAPQLIPLS